MRHSRGFYDHFFLISEESIAEVSTKLYGYILSDKLIESADCLDADPIGEGGAYVFVKDEDDRIRIFQDFSGCFGLYSYVSDGHFALSNSFQFLLDYLGDKSWANLSENREYNEHMICCDLTSFSYQETPIEEISLFPRDVVVTIDKRTKEIETETIDYCERTIPINSSEALDVLDSWFEKWMRIYREASYSGVHNLVELSGGMDSRISFAIYLNSRANRNAIQLYTIQDDLHTHAEDLEIATELAEKYGMSLNKKTGLEPSCNPFTVMEVLEGSLYPKLGWCRQYSFRLGYARRNIFGGYGGEAYRNYWSGLPEEFVNSQLRFFKALSASDYERLSDSMRAIVLRSLQKLAIKYDGLGRPLRPEELANRLYIETHSRFHDGKSAVEDYWSGTIIHAPLMDRQLAKLKFPCEECPDFNLLYALIFTRYQPDLLDVRFASGRQIDDATIAYAKSINAKRPYKEEKPDYLVDAEANPAAPLRSRNKGCDSASAHEWLAHTSRQEIKDIFDHYHRSKMFRYSFTDYFTPTILEWADRNNAARAFHSEESIFAIMSAHRSIELATGNARPLIDYLWEYSQGPWVNLKEYTWAHPFLERLMTARIDIKNVAPYEKTLLVSFPDDDTYASMIAPEWFKRDGTEGYTITCSSGHMRIKLECLCSGELQILLRGIDFHLPQYSNRIPIRIDYQLCSVNGNLVSGLPVTTWHDEPFRISRAVKEGEYIELEVFWSAHEEYHDGSQDKPGMAESEDKAVVDASASHETGSADLEVTTKPRLMTFVRNVLRKP